MKDERDELNKDLWHFYSFYLRATANPICLAFYANAANSTEEMEVKLNDHFNPDLFKHLSALLWNSSVYKDKQQTFHSLQQAKIIKKLMGTKT